MCGTPSYLAPEVVLQQNVGGDHRILSGYDHLVDSWSVGVIVYCMYEVPPYHSPQALTHRPTG